MILQKKVLQVLKGPDHMSSYHLWQRPNVPASAACASLLLFAGVKGSHDSSDGDWNSQLSGNLTDFRGVSSAELSLISYFLLYFSRHGDYLQETQKDSRCAVLQAAARLSAHTMLVSSHHQVKVSKRWRTLTNTDLDNAQSCARACTHSPSCWGDDGVWTWQLLRWWQKTSKTSLRSAAKSFWCGLQLAGEDHCMQGSLAWVVLCFWAWYRYSSLPLRLPTLLCRAMPLATLILLARGFGLPHWECTSGSLLCLLLLISYTCFKLHPRRVMMTPISGYLITSFL